MVNVTRIVRDLRFVRNYVSKQPRNFAGFEAARARIVARNVDVDALTQTIHSVLFVSKSYALTPTGTSC